MLSKVLHPGLNLEKVKLMKAKTIKWIPGIYIYIYICCYSMFFKETLSRISDEQS